MKFRVIVDFIIDNYRHYSPAVPLVVVMLMTKGVREPFLVTIKQTSKYPFSSNRVYILCSYPTTVSEVYIYQM